MMNLKDYDVLSDGEIDIVLHQKNIGDPLNETQNCRYEWVL